MKKRFSLFISFMVFSLFLSGYTLVYADSPVFSANGFTCGKTGATVSCKGNLPNGKDTITGTGHNLVYLTVNTSTNGVPTRYSYFSDTGCLVGYTFNAAGNPYEAVASHRSGSKKTFKFEEGKYEALIEYCAGPGDAQTTATPAPSPEKK